MLDGRQASTHLASLHNLGPGALGMVPPTVGYVLLHQLTISMIIHGPAHRPLPLLMLSLQMILGCGKLSVKVSQVNTYGIVFEKLKALNTLNAPSSCPHEGDF